MIILDEQLLGRNLEQEIAAWYRGTVRFITDLRPNSVIKDDAIPVLLRQMSEPTDELRYLLQLPLLRTKAQRMDKVVRVSGTQILYYTWNDRTIPRLRVSPSNHCADSPRPRTGEGAGDAAA